MLGGRWDDYDQHLTRLCEQVLVSLIGDIGPWSQRMVLVGGLAPRYIIGKLPTGAPAHVGTGDIDLVIRLAVEDAPDVYATLSRNLRRTGFAVGQPSYQWSREVDGITVKVEFLCDTDKVEAGRIYRPGQGTGSGFAACNIPGAQLVTRDFIIVEVEAERLDNGGLSKVNLRVAGILAYVVLKVLAFQDRHGNKDAYDLIYTLVNYPGGGPPAAARAAATSPVQRDPQVAHALQLLSERFAGVDRDGPRAYAQFLADHRNAPGDAQLRNTAVEAIRQFLVGNRGRLPNRRLT